MNGEFCIEHGECKFKVGQCMELIQGLAEKVSLLESKVVNQDREYIKKFSELTMQFTLLEREIKQLSEQIDKTHSQLYAVMLSMNEQLKEYAEWTRERVEQEAETGDDFAKKNIESQEAQVQHFREVAFKVLGWVAAGATAVWALCREYFGKGGGTP